MKKVAIILPPEFRRLPAMYGGLYRWFEASQAGLLPKPSVIIGSSAGAITGAACLPWTEANFAKIGHLIRSLKTKHIFTIPRDLETEMLLLIAPYILFFLDAQSWSKRKRLLLHFLELASSLGLSAFLFKQFLNRQAVFSNDPLRKLLKNNFDFEAIFNSTIRLELLTTNIETAKEVVFCNHALADQDSDRFVDAILASAQLPGRFPPAHIDGKTLGDGGILGYAPLQRAILAGCDTIVVFLFTPLEEQRPLPRNFIEDLVAAANITEMLATRLTVYSHREKLKRGAPLPTLHIVEALRPLANMTFKSFTEENILDSMNLGYEALAKDLPAIQRLVA